jgi:hypothetical protein
MESAFLNFSTNEQNTVKCEEMFGYVRSKILTAVGMKSFYLLGYNAV